MPSIQPITLDTDLGPMAAYRGGEAGPWVMCWPAMMGDHRSMRDFASHLTARHRVLLVDPPGFGANRGIRRWPAVAHQAALAHQMLDAAGADAFHWVGQGFGAHVGASLVSRVGYRMRSITLASAPFVQPARVNLLSQMIMNLMFNWPAGRHAVMARVAQQMAPQGASEHTLVREHIASVTDSCNVRVLKQLRPTLPTVLLRLREQLTAVTIPKLVLAGSYDTMVLPRDQRTLADVLGARYEEVASGFMAFLVQPQACATAVLGFLQDHPHPAAD